MTTWLKTLQIYHHYKTWLKENYIKNVRLKGYSPMNSFNRTHHIEGGVAIYVSGGLKNDKKEL